MSAPWGLFDPALVEGLGWALFHSVWQGAVLALIFALLRLALRRSSANARYLAACAMLLSLLAAPLATALHGPLKLHASSDAQSGNQALAGPGTAAARAAAARSAGPESLTWGWLLTCGNALEGALPSVVTAWLLGVALLSWRWLQGCRWVRRVRTVQVEPVDPAWLAVLEYLKCRFEIRRPVRLVQSALAEVPMVAGWLKPVILLPASTLAGLTPDQLEAILAHELAHVRRYDHVVNALQCLIETLMFYHPAVWWISRCIRQEREHCCDDLVVRVCRDRLVYARALVRLEELRGTPARLALAATGGSLLQRIRRLAGGAPEAWPVTVREFSGLTLLAVGCVLLLTGACLMFSRETFSGPARIRIERAPQPVAALIPGQAVPSCTTPTSSRPNSR